MSDLISRGDAIKAVLVSNFSACTVFGRSEEGMATAKELIQVIKNLPSAQPEIIRCKDCKHYVIHTFFGRAQGWCERLCDEFDKSLARGTEADDYCSRAEGREDE